MTTSQVVSRRSDLSLIAALTSWEQLFGKLPLSWAELEGMGLEMTPGRARQCLGGGLGDQRKEALLCKELFSDHPELEAFLRRDMPGRQQRKSTEPHFIAKLAEGGGPYPRTELDHISMQSRESPDHLAWFPTRIAGVEWGPPSDESARSFCLVFYRDQDGSLDVVAAEVRQRSDRMPDDDQVRKFYAGHEGFRSWWQLANPRRGRLNSYEEVPGTSRAGRPAAESFCGHVSFAYWRFPEGQATKVSGLLPRPSKSR